MRKSIQIVSMLVLSFSAMSINIENANISNAEKKVIMEGFELKQSIKEYQDSKRGTGFATVGSAAQCDYHLGSTKIQDAIDAGETELRLVSETFDENILIDDITITIKGGYANCTDAQAGTRNGSYAKIKGVNSAGLPTVRILGSTQRDTVIFDQIDISNGVGSGFLPGGGISTLSADVQVNLNKVSIFNNNGALGGGVAIVAGNTDFSMYDTLIYSNTATTGGGLYCGGSEATVFMDGYSGISVNTANGTSSNTGDGGGVFLENSCTFSSYSGTAGGFLDLRGIAVNNANGNGGGIYAKTGAKAYLYGNQFCLFFGGSVFCSGDNTTPMNLSANNSDNDTTGSESGGGAYITGANTQLVIYNGYVHDNITGTGSGDGGGIALYDGAKLVTRRITTPCWSQTNCNYFVANKSGESSGFGGAIYNNASTVEITNTVFEDNRSDLGTAIYAIGTASQTTVKGSIFNHNGDNASGNFNDAYVFRVFTDADLDIEHSTIADNNVVSAIFGIDSASGGNSTLYSSIVHETGGSPVPVYDTNPGTIANDCVIAHETTSFTPTFATIIDDPQFIDRANRDYHISNTSPAIDYCDTVNTDAANYKDIDNQDRGWDDPTVSNNLGPYDIGADETYANDIIFKNGFE